MAEVREDAVNIIGREGRRRRVQLAGLFDPRHDRALRAQAGHVARLALAGREVGGLGKVVKDRLRLLPLGNACLSLTHAVVLDVRVLRRLGRLARIVLQVLVVEDETFLEPGVIVVQIINLQTGIYF